MLCSLFQRLRLLRVRFAGARLTEPRWLGADIDVRPSINPACPGLVALGENAWIESGVVLHAYGGSICVGRNIFLGPRTVIYGHGGVEIGDDCLIAMHCRIISSNHTIAPYGTLIRSQPDIPKRTTIGRDVWLGSGVTVLGGVTIGDGCVVGAGAVVTKDLPSGAIAHGTPAVVRGWRQGAPQPSKDL